MKTGNTAGGAPPDLLNERPQWSPVMKTGNTTTPYAPAPTPTAASMEPGHEDREYAASNITRPAGARPQWSPVMKTGNTGRLIITIPPQEGPQWSPVMKTGNTRPRLWECPRMRRLNGARS